MSEENGIETATEQLIREVASIPNAVRVLSTIRKKRRSFVEIIRQTEMNRDDVWKIIAWAHCNGLIFNRSDARIITYRTTMLGERALGIDHP